MRLRKRAAGLLLGAAVLFLIGTNVQAGWLYVIAALLLGALAAGLALPFAALRGLSIELAAPEEAEQGTPTIVELRVRGTGRGVRRNVTVGTRISSPSDAPAGDPATRTGRGDPLRTPRRRGEILTLGVELRSDAPFGVAERRIRAKLEARTLVLPRVFPLGTLSFVEPIATNARAVHEAPRRGQGPDYLSVREYRPGDPMRHVHWALTARHGRLMVREFEEERTRRLVIVVDTERDEGDAWTPLDRCCSVAASVLDAATAHGQGARLIAARPGLGIDAPREPTGRSCSGGRPRGWSERCSARGGAGRSRAGRPSWVSRRSSSSSRSGVAGRVLGWTGRPPAVGLVPRVVCVLAEPGAGEAGPVAEALTAAGADVRRWGPADDLAEAMSREEVRA